MNSVPISIIVPAYNVEDYLDDCIKSILGQTFGDFELILINDGSIDKTAELCSEWSKIDSRIRFFDCNHRGLSAGRNFGIKQATGEYIIFIDSDDWIENDYVEKLYNKIIESQADIVECDFWRYNNKTHEKTYRPCYGRMGIGYSRDERLLYGESVAWKYISRRDMWINNNISFPDCLGASHAVYVILILLGMTFENVREPLYYYRRMRKGSILDVNGKGSSEKGQMGLGELSEMIAELDKRNLLKKNEELVQRAVKYRMSDLLAAQYNRKTYEEFREQRENYYDYLNTNFRNYKNDRYMIVGGYNLNRILSYLDYIQDPYTRFNFSSLISIDNPITNSSEIEHSNVYRKVMIEKDKKSLFWDILNEINPKYLFFDLIDDRFNVVHENDGYYTFSNAYPEDSNVNGKMLPVGTNEYETLWEKSVKDFFEKIFKKIEKENVILVENYLSTSHGDTESQKPYVNLEEIESINLQLKHKYNLIKSIYPEIRVVEAYKEQFYFTDDEYEYGVYPEHLNEIVNKRIANVIEKKLK